MSFVPSEGDSAGQPWEGRRFSSNPHSDDDGTADPAWLETVSRFRAGVAPMAEVVAGFASTRFLIPLIAELGEEGENAAGVRVDKSQELSIVSVAGPDGRPVLPVFSSVEAMGVWNPDARPVPAEGVRVALAAAREGTQAVVVDATSSGEFALRRPALWAVAQQRPWSAPWDDPLVRAEFEAAAAGEPSVLGLALRPGDPDARLHRPELTVSLTLAEGLDEAAVGELMERLASRWSASETIADRVDSLGVVLAGPPRSGAEPAR